MRGLIKYYAAKKERRLINERSGASDPLGLRMSDAKLRTLCPSLYMSSGPIGFLRCLFSDGLALRFYLRDMLIHGDSRAAVVVSESPLLVASYCDDLDAVCLLRFPDEFALDYRLRVGSRLVTVLNSMSLQAAARPEQIAPDLIQGDRANPLYVDFWPLIGELLSDEEDILAYRKEEMPPEEFERCQEFGEQHLKRFGGAAREGRPDRSFRPARIRDT